MTEAEKWQDVNYAMQQLLDENIELRASSLKWQAASQEFLEFLDRENRMLNSSDEYCRGVARGIRTASGAFIDILSRHGLTLEVRIECPTSHDFLGERGLQDTCIYCGASRP